MRTSNDLINHIDTGANVEFLQFWGHRPREDGSIGPSCLSQWWQAPFTVDGLTFGTAEHHMMWGKATLFGDEDVAARILAASHPRDVKKLGRTVRGFDQDRWAEARFDIVVRGNVAKFGQHRELRRFLLDTGDQVLVEASPVDRVWGTGLAADDSRSGNPRRWLGLNLLGFALMETRSILRAR